MFSVLSYDLPLKYNLYFISFEFFNSNDMKYRILFLSIIIFRIDFVIDYYFYRVLFFLSIIDYFVVTISIVCNIGKITSNNCGKMNNEILLSHKSDVITYYDF